MLGSNAKRFLLPIVLLAALVALLGPSPAAADEDGETTKAQLPLKRVLLFTSGVGYFEHRGDVEGDVTVELTFNVDDVNDLLKSMVVQDLGGGRVSTVSYGSRDPVAKALQSFAVDLTENLTLSDLLQQVRGEKVYVETPLPLTGTILSVETRSQKVGDDVVPVQHLNLLTPEGLKSVPFDTIRSVRLLDERLDKEMRKALEILSLGRDEKKKTVTLEFLGDGERTVRVGYVQETPLWKTSYRLVLDEEEKPFLQGWAIVENTTDQDWEGVALTLVSGQPISYTMNLYQPLYAQRPEVQPQLPAGVQPQTYQGEMQDLREELRKAESARGRARRSQDRAPARDAAPSARPGAPAEADWEGGGFDPGAGVEAVATGGELGELFQYTISEPVHLRRQRSAMLPILNASTDGEKISIYDPSVHVKHPLNAVQIVNTTGLHIMQGPVTVFDGGAYAGDALVGDMPPGAKRLLSYALDLEVEVATEGKGRPDELKSVRLAKGLLWSTHVRQRGTTYIAKNEDGKARKLLIARPFDASWELVSPKSVEERTRDQYRFALELPAGATDRLDVVEEQVVRQQVAITNLSSNLIAFYLESPLVSSAVKQALAEVVKRKLAIDDLQRQAKEIADRLQAIDQEQARIRANMGEIDHGTDLYARYLTKFSEQEDLIESLRQKMQQLQDEVGKKNQALGEYLLGLEID